MSHGDHKLQNPFQLANWCVAMVEGPLVDYQVFPLSKDSLSLLSVHVISQQVPQILYFLVGDPLNRSLKYWILLVGGHLVTHT